MSVETDPEKLVNFVCGSDYRTEEHREGDVPIKPDSEYPSWLFTMDVTRPKPNAIDMENKNTIEYYERLRHGAMRTSALISLHTWLRVAFSCSLIYTK